MSTLKERLHADVVSHMKDGNRVALSAVRNVLSEIDTREKAGKTPIHMDDAQITVMLQKEAAKRHETAHIYEEAKGRPLYVVSDSANVNTVRPHIAKAVILPPAPGSEKNYGSAARKAPGL